MTQNGERVDGDDSEIFPDSETTINEYVAKVLEGKSDQDHDNIIYLSGFCMKAEGYAFEIAIKTV